MDKKIPKIIIVLGIVFIAILSLYLFLNKTPKKEDETISVADQANIQTIEDVPTDPTLSNGYSIDTSSEKVLKSTDAIKKLESNLPYIYSFTSKGGILVNIVIPRASQVGNEWVLLVNMDSIDYQVSEDHPDHIPNKEAFFEGVDNVLSFLQQNQVNPADVFIQWGDREITQSQSSKWLKK